MDEGYTLEQAAERLGLAKVTVRKMIRQGRINAHLEKRKHGMTYILTEEDIRRFTEPAAVEVYRPNMGDTLRGLESKLSMVDQRSTLIQDEIKVLIDTVTTLQSEVTQLRAQLAPPKRRRWPWSRD